MLSTVLFKDEDGEWRPPRTDRYANEAHLQDVIAKQPSLVPGVTSEARTARELSTSAGPIDVCVVDVDGEITVVECKLASNPEKRRMVIGQVIDYASALADGGLTLLLSAWATRTNTDLAADLDEAALQRIERNLQTPRVHMCLAVDEIDDDLRRLIEFLNRITGDGLSVTALELSYAKHGEAEILIPTTFGSELVLDAPSDENWTLERYLSEVNDDDRPFVMDLAERLEKTEIKGSYGHWWFGQYPYGSLFIHPFGLRYAPIQLWKNSAGRAMVTGLWGQYGGSVYRHAGYAPVAELLGQDHEAGSTGVPLAELNIGRLWAACVRTAAIINGLDSSEFVEA